MPASLTSLAVGLPTLTAIVLLAPGSDALAQRIDQPEPVIGLPCEGCDAVFDGRPAILTSAGRIATRDEPGAPMRIEGTVRHRDGRPAPGVIVYAYHTDARGIYPRDESRRGQPGYRHGRLRGWVETDAQGRYRFDTIRPASYPDRETPAHVHMHVIEPGCCTYYLASIHFDDDPLLSSADREAMAQGRGGSGLVHPERNETGVWIVRRDIVLGEGVPGYPEEPADTRHRDRMQ